MTWVVGAAMNLVGSVMINCGTNIMKLGHSRSQKRRRRLESGWYSSRRPPRTTSGTGGLSSQPSGGSPREVLPPLPRGSPKPQISTVTSTTTTTTSTTGAAATTTATAPACQMSCCQGSWTCKLCPTRCECEMRLLSRTWIIGMVLFASGSLLNFLSFSYAAQSLLASLGSVQFVTNVFFAHAIINEPIRRRTVFGTVVLIIGVCLVVAFSCHGNPATSYSLGELEKLFVREPFLVYLGVLLFLWISSNIVDYKLHRMAAEKGARGLEVYATPLGFSYAAVSAIIGAQSVTLFKIVSELFAILTQATSTDDISAKAVVKSPFFYGMIFAAVLAAIFWIYRLNRALEMFDAMFIVPLFQVFWITLSVIGGGIFFREFEECFHGTTATFFVIGLLIIFLGVYLLSPRYEDSSVGQTENRGSSLGSNLSQNGRRRGSPPVLISSDSVAPTTMNWVKSSSHSSIGTEIIDEITLREVLAREYDNGPLLHHRHEHQVTEIAVSEMKLDERTVLEEAQLGATLSVPIAQVDDFTVLVGENEEGEEEYDDDDLEEFAESDPTPNEDGTLLGHPLRMLHRSLTGINLSSAFNMPILDAHDLEDIREAKRLRNSSQN